MTQFVQVYDSRSEEYRRAFAVFLAHTDEKQVICSWLSNLIDALPARAVFIDAGAGVRVQAPGGGAIRVDVAQGLRGGGLVISAGWDEAWPR